MNMIMNKKLRLTRNQKGMTLIELMAVVVILGILAAVAGAAVVGGFDKAKTNADSTSKTVIEDAAQRYILDKSPTDLATVTIDALKTSGYLKDTPKPSDSTKKFTLAVTKDSAGVYTYTVGTVAGP